MRITQHSMETPVTQAFILQNTVMELVTCQDELNMAAKLYHFQRKEVLFCFFILKEHLSVRGGESDCRHT